jgi:hypothetical protein
VSDPVSIKPSLVPETLEPVHGVHHKTAVVKPHPVTPFTMEFPPQLHYLTN